MPDVTKTAAAVEDAVAPPSVNASAPAAKQEKAVSLWGDAWADLRRNPHFIISSALIALLLLISAWPTLFTSASPTAGDLVHHFLSKPELGNVGSPEWLG